MSLSIILTNSKLENYLEFHDKYQESNSCWCSKKKRQ